MASTMNVPLPWSGTQTCVPCPPASSTSRSRTRALSLMNSTSREPQSRSIAALTVREVVSGPGVSSQGSRRGSVMAWCSSALDLEAVGIVGGAQAALRADAVGPDLDREPGAGEKGRVDALGLRDVAHGDGAAERVAVGRGRRRAHDAAVAPDGLVAQRQGLGIVQDEIDEAPGKRLAAPRDDRLAADEGCGLVEADGEPQPGLERRVVGRELPSPGAVGLLDTQ